MPQQQQFSGNPFLLGDSERGSYDYSGMTPEEAQTQRNIAQRRQMAKLMMYQGQQQAGKKGGMVGNIYVKASPMEGLAGVGQVGLGGLADYFLNKESTEETKKQAKDRKARIDEYIAATTDTPALPASKPLRPESFGESNLNQIIRETNPEQASQLGPRDIPTPSLRPMNKVSQTMMDMQVKAPQRLSPEQEKFALRFGEGPQDPFAGGMMGDGSGPAVAGTPYQPGAYTPKEIGPETPGTPGITRSQGEIQRAGLKAFAYGDPRLDKLVGHVTDQRNQNEQNQLRRQELLAKQESDQVFKMALQDRAIAGQSALKGQEGADARLAAKTKEETAVVGQVEILNKMIAEGDPNSPATKALKQLLEKLTTHTPAASQTMSIDQGGPLAQEMMKKAGDNVAKTLESAQVAQRSLQTIQKVEEAIRTGKVISGPGATPTIYLRQLGSVLGVTGKDSEEILKNTRVAIQGMAQLQIDSSKAAQGQGAISDYERKLFERASAGGDLTNGEIAELMVAIKKVAQFTISANTQNVQKIRNLPKGGDVVAPFFELPKDTGTQSSSPSAVSPTKLNQGWSLELK